MPCAASWLSSPLRARGLQRSSRSARVEWGGVSGSPGGGEQAGPSGATPSACLVHALAPRALLPGLRAPPSPSGAGRPRRGRGRCGAETAAGRHQGGCRGPPMVGGRLAAGTTARHQAAGRQGRPSPRGGDAAEHFPRHLPSRLEQSSSRPTKRVSSNPFWLGGRARCSTARRRGQGPDGRAEGQGDGGRGQGEPPGEVPGEGAEVRQRADRTHSRPSFVFLLFSPCA